MAKLTLEDFEAATKSEALRKAAPMVAHLPPQEVFDLWQRMPCGSLPKEQIFAGALALFIEHAAKVSKARRPTGV